MTKPMTQSISLTALLALAAAASLAAADTPGHIIVPASEQFPRNGEGSMVVLQNGSILLLYGAQSGTGDWAIGVIREIRSDDGGETWSEPRTLFTDPQRSLFPNAARSRSSAAPPTMAVHGASPCASAIPACRTPPARGTNSTP
jgi:hypothetical protein